MAQFSGKQKCPYILRTFDVETTGHSPAAPGDLIEIGWCDSVWNGDHFLVMPPSSILVKPDRPITTEGRAVHHISPGDLQHAMSRDDAIGYVQALPPAFAYAAHNASYEIGVLPELSTGKWVCTFKCGTVLFPDAEKHTNQFLRYHLDVPLDRSLAQPPHRAAPDAYVSAHLLLRYLQDADLRTLLQISSEPLVLPRVTFGEHRGKVWSDPTVPASLLTWALGKDGFTPEVHLACRKEIERRTQAAVGHGRVVAAPSLASPAVNGDDAPFAPPISIADRADTALRIAGQKPTIFV